MPCTATIHVTRAMTIPAMWVRQCHLGIGIVEAGRLLPMGGRSTWQQTPHLVPVSSYLLEH